MSRVWWILVATLVALPWWAEAGVSVRVGEPGFYGRIDIGNIPPPVVINPRPVIIQQAPVIVAPQPLYLRVPPGHAKHWHKHCHRYHACGQPVHFVDEHWYHNAYGHKHRGGKHHKHREKDDEKYGRDEGRGKGHKKHHED